MIQIHEFFQSLTRTNIPFLVSKQGSPTFSDLVNFLNIKLRVHARTNFGLLYQFTWQKSSEGSYSSTALIKEVYFSNCMLLIFTLFLAQKLVKLKTKG